MIVRRSRLFTACSALAALILIIAALPAHAVESDVSQNIDKLLQFQSGGSTTGPTSQSLLATPAAAQQTNSGPAAGNMSLQSNAGTGFAANANGGSINLTMTGNTFNNNSSSGMALNAANGGSLGGTVTGNIISGNQANGIVVGASNGNVNLTSVSNNILAGNSVGVLFDSVNSNVSVSMFGNQIVGDAGNANNSFGVGGTVSGGSFNLTFGDSNFGNANTINQHANAGIGFQFSGDAQAALNIQNNNIGNTASTTAGTSQGFNGAGIQLNLSQDAQLSNSQIDNNLITGNDGKGVGVEARNDAGVDGLVVSDNDIVDNDGTAVEFDRLGSGTVTGVEITSNLIDGNAAGLDIGAANTSTTDSYTISGNLIQNNTDFGIQFDVQADAELNVQLSQNVIDQNGGNGINVVEQANSANDQRALTGNWTLNVVTNNGGNGISIDGATGTLTSDLVIGSLNDPLEGNFIDGNNLNGVVITGPGDVLFANNVISNNAGHGFDVDNPRGENNVFLVSNSIVQNGGDGLEINNNSRLNDINVFADGNLIADNGGRGVDILNQGANADTFVSLNANTISGNGEEGVYLVNTASTAQNQSDASTANKDATGGVFNDPRLNFVMNGNTVTSNGSASGLGGTGLVILVGTTQAEQSVSFTGGFASDGMSGVLASVEGNNFGGNFGDDVYIQSFTSTGPSGTGTTWTDTTVNNNGYQSDPLARLDLVFNQNFGDSASLNNTGAYYDNADATFKSRLTTTNQTTAPGPFTDASRRRNAQRLAFRDNLSPGNNSNLQYPGLGASTFRVQTDGVDLGAGFIFDLDNYDSRFDARGVNYPGSLGGQELPYGWGKLP